VTCLVLDGLDIEAEGVRVMRHGRAERRHAGRVVRDEVHVLRPVGHHVEAPRALGVLDDRPWKAAQVSPSVRGDTATLVISGTASGRWTACVACPGHGGTSRRDGVVWVHALRVEQRRRQGTPRWLTLGRVKRS
jgi:hypothetical protein